MSYPKWVQRAAHIGAVLCTSEDEEKKLLADYAAEQAATAKAAEAEAKGPDMGKLPLNPTGKPK